MGHFDIIHRKITRLVKYASTPLNLVCLPAVGGIRPVWKCKFHSKRARPLIFHTLQYISRVSLSTDLLCAHVLDGEVCVYGDLRIFHRHVRSLQYELCKSWQMMQPPLVLYLHNCSVQAQSASDWLRLCSRSIGNIHCALVQYFNAHTYSLKRLQMGTFLDIRESEQIILDLYCSNFLPSTANFSLDNHAPVHSVIREFDC